MGLAMVWWMACGGSVPDGVGESRRFDVTGTVVELRGDDVVVIDHAPIPDFMDAMVMPFTVDDPALLEGVDVGEGVAATLVVTSERSRLSALRVTEPLAAPAPAVPPVPVERGVVVPQGEVFPATPVILAEGAPLVIGEGQSTGGPIAFTFIYTRCPIPEYCPLVVARFVALQEQLPPGARLLAVTMDPDFDTRSVLSDFADQAGARPGRWDFGRVPKEVLIGVAEKSGLAVTGRGTAITHDLVMVILDAEGRVVKRYRDFDWDMTEVVGLLGG